MRGYATWLSKMWVWVTRIWERPPALKEMPATPINSVDDFSAPAPRSHIRLVRTPEQIAEIRNRRVNRKARDRVASDVWDILERFENLSLVSQSGGTQALDNKAALADLIGCDFYFLNELVIATTGNQDAGFSMSNSADLLAAAGPIDTALVVRKSDHYQLHRVRFMTDKSELRGRVIMVPPHCVCFTYARLYDDGKWWAEKNYAGLVNGRWIRIDGIARTIRETGAGAIVSTSIVTPELAEQTDRSIQVACSVAVSMRYDWHVAFGPPSGPRILLPTTPQGCLGTFRDRELRVGETRRAALRHWVRNHYREISDVNLAYVRDHLRGCTEFAWKDLHCELLVSEFDLERNEIFKQQADQWRSARKHNRVRVRLKRRA